MRDNVNRLMLFTQTLVAFVNIARICSIVVVCLAMGGITPMVTTYTLLNV